MSNERIANAIIEGGKLVYRNFTGRAGQFNAEGDRNFSVVLDDEVAKDMWSVGWNVRGIQDGEKVTDYNATLPVKVSFDIKPPSIFIIQNGTKRRVREDEVGDLDQLVILNADMIITPYQYKVGGKEGVKAYLKELYVEIETSPLADKYADLEEIRA